LACAVYDEAAAWYGETMYKPKLIALQAIRDSPISALLKKNEFGNQEPGVFSLGSTTVEMIVVSIGESDSFPTTTCSSMHLLVAHTILPIICMYLRRATQE
jgi:hypothetical protein